MEGIEDLSNFINKERERFETRENNLFANSFKEIIRYHNFLKIILRRYKLLVSENAKVFYEFQESIDKSPGSHRETDKQAEIRRKMTELAEEIHSEVESFYMFFKILVDKISFSVQYYFGKSRKVKMSGHHSMVEKFNDSADLKIIKYCVEKGLTIKKAFIEKMKIIQNEILDFRDDQIVHNSSPRIIRGTGVDGTMSVHKALYPEIGEETKSSTSLKPEQVMSDLNDYIELLIAFINDNREKTVLPIRKA